MSANAADKYFWLAYAKAIQRNVSPSLGKDSAIFFATKAQKGPLASEDLPVEYTNFGLYTIGDNLLSADNLFYDPSSKHSYIRSLLNYLTFVDLGENHGPRVYQRLKHAHERVIVAHDTMMDEARKAAADFAELEKLGLTNGLKFPEWCNANAFAFSSAEKEYTAATADEDAVAAELDGPYAAQLKIDKMRINNAMEILKPARGLNMPATSSPAPSAKEIYTKKTIEKPESIYVPEYSSLDYSNTVKDWIEEDSHGRPGAQTLKINIKEGKDVDTSDFGQVNLSGGASVDYFPWISFGSDPSSDKEEGVYTGEFEDNDVEIDLTYDEIQKVSISPGQWDIGNPKDSYPKLLPHAPITAQILVRPTQLVLIKNLGYKIKCHNASRSTFDKSVKHVKQINGYFRLFGIPIKIDGDRTERSEHHSHVGQWDEANGEFVVTPTEDGFYATVISILGDKIKTT